VKLTNIKYFKILKISQNKKPIQNSKKKEEKKEIKQK
jgi:hypothetical protein